jgi:uncharacterized protein YbjT (DUF2867 family)
LRAQGHEVVSASRASGVDAVTGAGLSGIVKGAQVVIDVTNSPSFEPTVVMTFFQTSTRNMLSEEATASVRHHVMLSVVGADRMPDNAYMRAKVAQETLIQAGRVPYTILRTTQFFEFIGTIADVGTIGDIARLPPRLFQPIAANDVVGVLAKIAVGTPANGIVDLAGPEQLRLDEAARRVLTAKRDPRQIIGDPQALYFGGTLDDRSLVPAADYRVGTIHFEDWLAGQP